jgi:hypothetical protein
MLPVVEVSKLAAAGASLPYGRYTVTTPPGLAVISTVGPGRMQVFFTGGIRAGEEGLREVEVEGPQRCLMGAGRAMFVAVSHQYARQPSSLWSPPAAAPNTPLAASSSALFT